jgi:predicted ATPase
MARLDRLGSAKEVAQIGAAIGREFSYALLAAVARKANADLASALERLIEAGLLLRLAPPANTTRTDACVLVRSPSAMGLQ